MMELWPFTNFHDLNLDWLISKWKKLEDNLDDIHASRDAAEGYADDAEGYMLDAKSSKTQAAIFATQAGNSAESAATSAESIAGVANQVQVNTAAIDGLIAQAGDTDNNAELLNIRIGYDGRTYTTAGDAVRGSDQTIDETALESWEDFSFSTVPGYMNPSGGALNSAGATTQELTTDYIPVRNIEKFRMDINNMTSVAMWAAYAWYDENFQSAAGRQVIINNDSNVEWTFFLTPPSNAVYLRISWRTFGTSTQHIYAYSPYVIRKDHILLDEMCPAYDHTFINKISGTSVIIPFESVYNIESSKRLGFEVIEANCKATSDGYIICHGAGTGSLYFGQQFEHVDGVTDVSQTLISSVTTSWVKANLRYKDIYSKYKVAPLTLEEFLLEANKAGLKVLLQYVDDNQVAIANEIIGTNNYILYGSVRPDSFEGPIMYYGTFTNTADIIALLDMLAPACYCMENTRDYNLTQLKTIAGDIHEAGYKIGMVPIYDGMEPGAQVAKNAGFDFVASSWEVPEIETPETSAYGDIDWTDFDTDGTITNNTVVLAPGQYIRPVTRPAASFLEKATLDINFVGEGQLDMGEYMHTITINSTGEDVQHYSTYGNMYPTWFQYTANTATTINTINFKRVSC